MTGAYFDAKEQRWVSVDGQEVCQDHIEPKATCPYRHGRPKP